jgi:DNA-binding transcriptional regulator YiaG
MSVIITDSQFGQYKKLMSAQNTISAAQCRAARGLVNMTQGVLAAAALVSKSVIVDFENGHRTPNRNNLAAIRRALEDVGVVFLHDGVRLKSEG